MSCVIEFMALLRYTMLMAILILLINLLVSVEGSAHGLRPKMLPYFDPEYENFNQRINPPRSRTLLLSKSFGASCGTSATSCAYRQ